jgi:hypothetical protein
MVHEAQHIDAFGNHDHQMQVVGHEAILKDFNARLHGTVCQGAKADFDSSRD